MLNDFVDYLTDFLSWIRIFFLDFRYSIELYSSSKVFLTIFSAI